VAWGQNADGQTNVPPGLTNAVAAAAGAYHGLALRADGTVAAWGRGADGQTNVPPGLTNAVAIAAGWYHSLALRADGTVAAWGQNTSGQTTVPPDLTNALGVAGGGSHSLALRAGGTVATWGSTASGLTNVPAGLTNAVAVAAGGSHSLALVPAQFLTVWSACGSPVPGVGTNTVIRNTLQTCEADAVVTLVSTQYLCAGWAGDGSAPASGSSNRVAFVITNDSMLAWRWDTNFWFEGAAGLHGSLAGDTNGWYALGGSVTVTAVADRYYHFTNWSGAVPPAQACSNPLAVAIDQARAVTACFEANVTPRGTPEPWIGDHDLTNLPPAEEDELDRDSDGMAAWQEYVADTDPTNPASRLVLAAVSNLPPWTVYFLSSTARQYALQISTNLALTNDWHAIEEATNAWGTGGMQALGDTNAAAAGTYRVNVRVP
jgi:hypothetical protein